MKEKKTVNPEIQTEAVTHPAPVLKPDAKRAKVSALLEMILESLEDSKAEEIVPINIEDKTSMADYMVIASGRSHTHVGATADHLVRAMKGAGLGTAKVEGLPACDWVLIDAGDIIVHIFKPEVREFYNLEKLWMITGTGEQANA